MPMTVNTEYADRLAEGLTAIAKAHGQDFLYEVIPGKKYDKVVKDHSVHAFVDSQGQVFKPEGWSRPAKGVRFPNVGAALVAANNAGAHAFTGGYLYATR